MYHNIHIVTIRLRVSRAPSGTLQALSSPLLDLLRGRNHIRNGKRRHPGRIDRFVRARIFSLSCPKLSLAEVWLLSYAAVDLLLKLEVASRLIRSRYGYQIS